MGDIVSYDFKIATNARFTEQQLRNFINSIQNVSIESSDMNHILIGRKVNDKVIHSFSCDINNIVDLDDVDEVFTEIVLSPKWLYEISVPSSSTKIDICFAKKLSEFIANECKGAAFDPQLEKIIFPKGKIKRYLTPSVEERINVIEFRWFISVNSLTNDTITNFISTIKKILPEALPNRYGEYEPLQYKLDKLENFTECIIENKSKGDTVFFKSTSPCFGGSISTSFNKFKPDNVKLTSQFSLSFDARPFEKDSNWNDVLVNLFIQLSIKLNAYYAMGYVEENIIAKRNSKWYDGYCKTYSLPPLKWWNGIPNSPMWLNWYGKPYIQEVEHSFLNSKILKFDSGFFFKNKEFPATLGNLKGSFPKISENLLASSNNPAHFIPNIDL